MPEKEFHDIYESNEALELAQSLETKAFKRLRESMFNDKYSADKQPFMQACGKLPITFADEEYIITLCKERWTPMAVRLFYYNAGHSQSLLAALHSIGVMDEADLSPSELETAEKLFSIAQARKHQRISEKVEQGFIDDKSAKVLLESYYGIAKAPMGAGGGGLGQGVELHIQAYVPPEEQEPETQLKEVS